MAGDEAIFTTSFNGDKSGGHEDEVENEIIPPVHIDEDGDV